MLPVSVKMKKEWPVLQKNSLSKWLLIFAKSGITNEQSLAKKHIQVTPGNAQAQESLWLERNFLLIVIKKILLLLFFLLLLLLGEYGTAPVIF